jgi:hypothetical protein
MLSTNLESSPDCCRANVRKSDKALNKKKKKQKYPTKSLHFRPEKMIRLDFLAVEKIDVTLVLLRGVVSTRVARWYILIPKIPIWAYFGGPSN